MFYTYVLKSKKDGKFYTGFTHDLRERFNQHNNNQVCSTKSRGPFEIIYYEACKNQKDATMREKYLKSGLGKRYLKNRLKRSLSQTGFTLIEIIIAIFILSVAVVGVYNVFSATMILSSGMADRLQATYLSQEGIEIIRNVRDNNWINVSDNWLWGLTESAPNCELGCEVDYTTLPRNSVFLRAWSGDGSYLRIDSNKFYGYSEVDSILTKFKRKITITQLPRNDKVYAVKVSSETFWPEKSNLLSNTSVIRSVKIEEVLYDWY